MGKRWRPSRALLGVLLIATVTGSGLLQVDRARLEAENAELEAKASQAISEAAFWEKAALNNARKVQELQQSRVERLDELEGRVEVKTMEITAYAPLDNTARAGMCYEGNPEITASGNKVQPGLTAAAGPDLPMGADIYIEGLGSYEVQDVGGAIGEGQVDVTKHSREQAERFGRQERAVVIFD